MKRIEDWSRQYIQFLIIILSIGLAIKFDFYKILLSVIKKVGFEDSELPALLRVVAAYGRIVLSIAIILAIICFIRKLNKEAILNSKNEYHDHYYIGYVACRYILGYSMCNLKLVPIPMQYKLVINTLFPSYEYSDGVHEIKDDKVKIIKKNSTSYTSTVNLIISDTFKISGGQLSASVLNLTTIEVDRSSDDHMRYYSEELLKRVISTVRELPDNVIEVNIFATTNATNTYRIAKEAFATGGRDKIKHIYVFPQGKDNARNFANRGMKIY